MEHVFQNSTTQLYLTFVQILTSVLNEKSYLLQTVDSTFWHEAVSKNITLQELSHQI